MSRLALLRGATESLSDRATLRGAIVAEFVVAALIAGLAAAFLAPHVADYRSSTRDEAARRQIKGFASALDLYNLDVGHYPTAEEGLQALLSKPDAQARWAGPYLRQATIPVDPWGEAYVYAAPGREAAYTVTSSSLVRDTRRR